MTEDNKFETIETLFEKVFKKRLSDNSDLYLITTQERLELSKEEYDKLEKIEVSEEIAQQIKEYLERNS